MAMPEGFVDVSCVNGGLPVGDLAAYLVLLNGDMTMEAGFFSSFLEGLLELPGAMVCYLENALSEVCLEAFGFLFRRNYES